MWERHRKDVIWKKDNKPARADEKLSERYYSVALITVGCVMGTVFAGDFLTLFIFWEFTAVSATFLILYYKTPKSLHATLKYLVRVIIASAFIIYGLSIMYSLTGTLNFWAVKHALIIIGRQAPP